MNQISSAITPEHFFLHFLTGRLRCEKPVRRRPRKKEKLNNNFDKLFFNFLIITMPEILSTQYDLVKERKLKYEFSHKMENMKYKKIDNVVNNLCYDNCITLHTLAALSFMFNKSIFYSNNNIYCTLNKTISNETSYYIVTQDREIYIISKERLSLLKETKFQLEDITRPFYSITYYKLDELRKIVNELNLELEDRKYCKKELYEIIVQYFNKVLY